MHNALNIVVPTRRILSCVSVSGYIFLFTFQSLSEVSYSDESRKKKAFQYVHKCCRFFVLHLAKLDTNEIYNNALKLIHSCLYEMEKRIKVN